MTKDEFNAQYLYDPRNDDPRERWEIKTHKRRKHRFSTTGMIKHLRRSGATFEIKPDGTIKVLPSTTPLMANDNDQQENPWDHIQ